MKSQEVQRHIIARSVATKQSHEIRHLENTGLLRSDRNDDVEGTFSVAFSLKLVINLRNY
jgi:hypothetical protein